MSSRRDSIVEAIGQVLCNHLIHPIPLSSDNAWILCVPAHKRPGDERRHGHTHNQNQHVLNDSLPGLRLHIPVSDVKF